jgi:hypothetical protein
MVLGLKQQYAYLLFSCLFLLGCGGKDISPQVLVTKRCSRCHTLERVHAAKKDAESWHTTVQKMASYASGVIPDKEIPIIINYLVKTQGMDKGERAESPGKGEERR